MSTAKTRLVRKRLLGLCVASAVGVGLEVFREFKYDTDTYRFLVWNLVLAWIPLLLALLIYLRSRRGSLLELAPMTALWLLFLPNSLYIVTDFVHLGRVPGAPLWLDGAILAVFASTGIVLGFVSVYLVQAVARQRLGALAGWCSVLVILGFASAGIFLGRILRWNSWDILVRPGERLAELASRLSDPSAIARAAVVTFALTLLLTAAYSCFYILIGARTTPNSGLNPNEVPRRF